MLWIILLISTIFLLFVLDWLAKDKEFEKISGPKCTIIIGNSIDFAMDSIKVFYHLRKLAGNYKNYFKLNILSKNYIVMYNPQDVETLLSGTKYSSKGFLYRFLRPWLKDGLLLSDGTKWHRRRKILTPTFHFNILRHFNSVLFEKTQNFVERLNSEVDNPATDIFPLITEFSLNSICGMFDIYLSYIMNIWLLLPTGLLNFYAVCIILIFCHQYHILPNLWCYFGFKMLCLITLSSNITFILMIIFHSIYALICSHVLFVIKCLFVKTAMGTALEEEKYNMGKRYKDAIHTLGTYLFFRCTKVWMYPDFIFNLSFVGRNQKKILDLIGQFRNKVIANRRIDTNVRYIDDDCSDEYFISKKKRLAMLDLLLQAEKDGDIDSEGINEEVDTFMFEGHDTVATGLQYIFMLLANHQEVQDKIVEECEEILVRSNGQPTINDMGQMKYLEACIKEALRLYPPVYFITRKADEPLELSGGHKCPAGTDYTVLIFDLHRRGDQFVEPLKFVPERFLKEPTWHPFSYIPFSAGPRNCIGQKFAMIEMKLLLCKVLREYRLLPVTKPEDIMFYADILLRSNPVKVKIEKRVK